MAVALSAVVLGAVTSCREKVYDVSFLTLLDEMVSVEAAAMYPSLPYRAFSLSGSAGAVIFNQKGPGVITRIRLAAEDRRGVVRFYFDGSSSAEITLPAYDVSSVDIPEAHGGLIAGDALYLPIPFNGSCRITFEPDGGSDATATGSYQIDYRRYEAEVSVETFSSATLTHTRRRIDEVNRFLLDPQEASATGDAGVIHGEALLGGGDPVMIRLPRGENAVYGLQVEVTPSGAGGYARAMRSLIIQGTFDGKVTLRAPVSDFSGGGAVAVDSRYFTAGDGGKVTGRWLMPYCEKASLAFINEGRERVNVSYNIYVHPLSWDDERSLYFHAAWKEEAGIKAGRADTNRWNAVAIHGGRGIYMGEIITFYNHTDAWPLDGDIEIGPGDTGGGSYAVMTTAGYYNISTPPAVSQTPFGGAPRIGKRGAYGYNTLIRTRILDGIPFADMFAVDVSLPGGKEGTIDCATTSFWYGDKKTRPGISSGPETWGRVLLPAPTDK
ncbi:MAG: DUF2961 domain-containing protein [Tannerellaceae bacterium]|nr:DUF2961 domain-containing protein [Tannerellaceae bacterium]